MASAQGTATIDFGSTPTNEGSVSVTGQATISATSHVEAFIMAEATGDNDADAHRFLALSAGPPVCDVPSAGVGFPISVLPKVGLVTGTFKIRWVWSD